MERYIGWHACRTRKTKHGVKHCAPVSLLNYAQELHMAVRILQPKKDWSWLRRDVDALADVAKPVRNKVAKLVPLEILYLLGEALADKAALLPPSVWTAVQERDGVLIAVLTLMPKRIGNFGQIRLGENLILYEHGEPIALEFERTKNGQFSRTPVPKRLRPILHRYLRGGRTLLNPHGSELLWLSERGDPLTFSGINAALKGRTLEEKTIGMAINAHAFRMIYATSIGRLDPDALPAGSWMLDQMNERTLIEHYSPIYEAAYASGKLDARTSALAVHPPRRKNRRRGPKKRNRALQSAAASPMGSYT